MLGYWFGNRFSDRCRNRHRQHFEKIEKLHWKVFMVQRLLRFLQCCLCCLAVFLAELRVKAAPWYDSWSTWISVSHFSAPSYLFICSLKIFVTIPIRCNSGGGDYTNTLISSELLKIGKCIESQNCLALLDLSPDTKKFRKIFIRELKVLDMPLWFRFSLSISHHAHRSFDPWPI